MTRPFSKRYQVENQQSFARRKPSRPVATLKQLYDLVAITEQFDHLGTTEYCAMSVRIYSATTNER